MSEKILEVKDLHFYYGEIHALKGISLDVNDREIVTLIGANGAGKTTTLRSISGLLGHIASGEIRFMGERIDNLKGYAIAAKGVAQCLEGRHVFANLTVKENLQMEVLIVGNTNPHFRTLDEAGAAIARFIDNYNKDWLI